MIQHLEPRNTMPTCKHMSNDIPPELYQVIETTVKNELQNANSIGITIDLWTTTATDSYLSINITLLLPITSSR